jgi:uncharacterized protein (TIRG00374 family)
MDDSTEDASRPKGGERETRHLGRNILIAVLVGLSINVLLGFFVDFDKFKAALAQSQVWEVLVPFAAILVVYVIDSLRYMLIFRQFGVRLSFGDSLYNNITGCFFSAITPSSAGGQPFQVYHFAKLGLDTTTSTNVVFSRLMVTNFVQLIVVLAFFNRGLSMLMSSGNGAYVLGIGMLTTALVSVLLLLVFFKPTLIGKLAFSIEHNRLGRFIGRVSKNGAWAEKLSAWCFELRDSFRFLWAQKTPAVIADILLFCLVQVTWAFGLYFPFRAMVGVSLPFIDFLFAFIVCGLVSSYIPTPGASGSVEAAYALVLGGLTGNFGSTLSAVFLWRLGSYYLHLLFGGIVYAALPIHSGVYKLRPDGGIYREKEGRNVIPPAGQD